MPSGGRGRRRKCGRSIFQIVIFQFQVVILSEAKDLAGCGKTSPQGKTLPQRLEADRLWCGQIAARGIPP